MFEEEPKVRNNGSEKGKMVTERKLLQQLLH